MGEDISVKKQRGAVGTSPKLKYRRNSKMSADANEYWHMSSECIPFSVWRQVRASIFTNTPKHPSLDSLQHFRRSIISFWCICDLRKHAQLTPASKRSVLAVGLGCNLKEERSSFHRFLRQCVNPGASINLSQSVFAVQIPIRIALIRSPNPGRSRHFPYVQYPDTALKCKVSLT